MEMGHRYFRFNGLLQKDGWLAPAYVGVDESGVVRYLSEKAPEKGTTFEAVEGYALPGFQNSHSHAFQYAMAGLAENHAPDVADDFWTWREAMYRCALSIDPDEAEAVAAMLYAEMLRHGYTHVAEFHYLHHDKDGKRYGHLAEMGERMVAAAETAGIKITLIPVFYQKGNFGIPAQPHQRRFISESIGDYFELLEASKIVVHKSGHARLGWSIHSLRAVDPPDIIESVRQVSHDLPLHIHVAEQKKEVADCLSFTGKRPMQWLLENLAVNDRFHFIHATHLDDVELRALATSGAHVVLCPSTEGNLGDGIFRMREYVSAGGHWSIGTDSHIGLNPLEELRTMDYRQRLLTHQRNIFKENSAQYLVNEEIASGRRAMGVGLKSHFEIGNDFDAVIYDAHSPLLTGTSLENVLPSLVYSADSGYNLGTIVQGKWVVKDQRHFSQEQIKSKFLIALKLLRLR